MYLVNFCCGCLQFSFCCRALVCVCVKGWGEVPLFSPFKCQFLVWNCGEKLEFLQLEQTFLQLDCNFVFILATYN